MPSKAERPLPLLVSVTDFDSLTAPSNPVIFDCRFDLLEPSQGRLLWEQGHIPGARYAHLDDDLAGPVTPESGRHPLPSAKSFAQFLARNGWAPGQSIIAYDAQGGAFASRLWWLMKYFGHDCVSLLDGGFNAWSHAGRSIETAAPVIQPAAVTSLIPQPQMQVTASEVKSLLQRQSALLVDARDADRFEGQNETIDPVAGHVPGAINSPFKNSLDASGQFLSALGLRQEIQRALPGQPPEQTIHMCGSGVTACHNLFSMELAGLPGGRLYAGSWSEWIRDPSNPTAIGPA